MAERRSIAALAESRKGSGEVSPAVFKPLRAPRLKSHPDCPCCSRRRAKARTEAAKIAREAWMRTPAGNLYRLRKLARRRDKRHAAADARAAGGAA
jgi:hypothetical protein